MPIQQTIAGLTPGDFGRIRSAAPHTLADLVHPYGFDTYDYDAQDNGGTIAYEADEGSIHLSATANGAAPMLRTWEDYRYQAGKGHVWIMTVIHDDTGVANQVRRWGYYDDNDGLFFELDGTDLYIVRRSSVSGSPVDTRVVMADWNVDRLDGTGPSGITLGGANNGDFALTDDTIYECRLQWLSAGPVHFYMGDTLVHELYVPIAPGVPYMRTAQLPLTWEVINSAATAGGGMRYVCASVTSDGGSDPPEHGFGYTLPAAVSVGTTEIPLFSMRAGALFSGFQSRRVLYPSLLALSSRTTRAAITVRWGCALTGATWAITPDTASSAEVDIAATAFGGGISLLRFYLAGDTGKEVDMRPLFTRNGRHILPRRGDAITVTAINEQAGTTDVHGALCWREIR